MVSRVIAAPVELVWRVFIDPDRRRAWAADGAQVRLTVLEPGRRCVVRLAGAGASHQREYIFTSIDIGPHRGSTVVTAVDRRDAGFAERLLDLAAGGFAARLVEGAVRGELDALAAACTIRVIALAAA